MRKLFISFFATVGFMALFREITALLDLPFFESKVDYLSAFLITALLYFQNKGTDDVKHTA
jgi:hypothetical protein